MWGIDLSFRKHAVSTWYLCHRVINGENLKNKHKAPNRRGVVTEIRINLLCSNVCSHLLRWQICGIKGQGRESSSCGKWIPKETEEAERPLPASSLLWGPGLAEGTL